MRYKQWKTCPSFIVQVRVQILAGHCTGREVDQCQIFPTLLISDHKGEQMGAEGSFLTTSQNLLPWLGAAASHIISGNVDWIG